MVSLHGDSVGNIDKDNSGIFSLTHMCYLSCQQGHVGSNTLLWENLQFLLE